MRRVTNWAAHSLPKEEDREEPKTAAEWFALMRREVDQAAAICEEGKRWE